MAPVTADFVGRRPNDVTHWSRARIEWAALLLFTISVAVRLGIVNRHGLWADELFSLAMATGHSLEHPASQADPALGDYVEAPGPVPASVYSRYLEHESPPAGLSRVIRAVRLSDTSPPLYYVLFYGWSRVVGASDAALRLFSVAAALTCFPILWSLARQFGGRFAALASCTLFALAPHCAFYSTEGRMYALLWLCTLAMIWLTLRLRRRGIWSGTMLLWVAASAAGLLTHYFFAFVWAAACAWLWLYRGKLSRLQVVVGAALCGLLVLPWYIHLPEMLSNWRITQGWLTVRPGGFNFSLAVLSLPWSFLSTVGSWSSRGWLEYANVAIYLTLVVVACAKLRWSLVTPRRQLLWLWLLAACLGPVLFDLWRGTYVIAVPRYALAGMPAAFLLVGLCLARINPRIRVVFLVLIVLVYAVAVRRIYLDDTRYHEPTRQLGQLLAAESGPHDLVIVHSIPSGVTGVARYLEQYAATKEVSVLSWVGQLGQRAPEQLPRHAARKSRIILVKIHEVGEPAPEEDWLRQHALLVEEKQIAAATVSYFLPRGTDTFFPEPAR